LLRVPGE
jgi:hypothetical protein